MNATENEKPLNEAQREVISRCTELLLLMSAPIFTEEL